MKQTLIRQLRSTRSTSNTLTSFVKSPMVPKQSAQERDALSAILDNIMAKPEEATIPKASLQKAMVFDSQFHRVEEQRVMATLLDPTTGNRLEKQLFTKPRVAIHKDVKIAMAKTTEYLQSGVMSDYDLMNFMETRIVALDNMFEKNKKRRLTNYNKGVLDAIKKQSSLNPTEPLINEYTVPVLLSEIIKILSESYRSPDSALALFHSAKQQSVKTYVYSCTIGVYNEVFRCHWKYYKSISMILELVNEMKVNGIQGNTDTYRILQEVTEDANKMLLYNDGVSFELSLERGPEKWTQMWNKGDVEDLNGVKQYIHDLFSIVTRGVEGVI